jgi:Flp pilus assembly protein TadG
MPTTFSLFRHALRRFGRAREGNVAIIFGLAAIPLIAFVGAAIDYSRANSVKTALQAALDSTGLMLSHDARTLSADQLKAKADTYFKALFTRTDAKDITVNATYNGDNGSALTVTATADVPTTFMNILGIPTMTVGSTTVAKWGNKRLRVALVLDNTGSMADDGKIDALKTATNNLLDQLKNAVTTDGDVYVSIVPFVKDVNVGPPSPANASWVSPAWIDWTEWEGEPPILDTANGGSKPNNWYNVGPGSSCPFSTNSQGFRCTNGPATSGASNISTIPSSGNYRGLICPGIDNGNRRPLKASDYYNGCYNSWTKCVGANCRCTTTNTSICSCTGSGASKTCTVSANHYEHTWRPAASETYTPALVLNSSGLPYATPGRYTWNGCVTDRGFRNAPDTVNNYDTNAAAPDPITPRPSSLYAAEQYSACPQPVAGLSYDWAAMKTLVNNMSPNGNTNQAIGLQLGWMSLVGGGPFPAPPPLDPNYQYKQVIILLTDGLNTEDRWYTSQSSIDSRQKLTCNNFKAASSDNVLYTIQVNTGGDPTSTLLQNCASSFDTDPKGQKFFLLTSADQIVQVFNQIGTALTQLRLAQ